MRARGGSRGGSIPPVTKRPSVRPIAVTRCAAETPGDGENGSPVDRSNRASSNSADEPAAAGHGSVSEASTAASRSRSHCNRAGPPGGALGAHTATTGAEDEEASSRASSARRSSATCSRRSGGTAHARRWPGLQASPTTPDCGAAGSTRAADLSSIRRRSHSASRSASATWSRARKRAASGPGSRACHKQPSGMTAAASGTRWAATQTGGGGANSNRQRDAAPAQTSAKDVSQPAEPVAGQPQRTCSSSSTSAPQHRHAALATPM